MRVVAPLGWVTTADLITPVAALTGAREVRIDDWSSESITGGAGEALGVWRVTGEATVDGNRQSFTLILKGWPPTGAHDPTAWDWPDRERLAYTSGMLDALPGGIEAPRSYGEVRLADGSTWVWLGPMSTGALERWALEDFATVARRLGRFNGAYLSGEALPDAVWLSHGWTRRWTEAASDAVAMLPEAVSHPLVARVYPADVVAGFQRIWSERESWFSILDALPQVFCHLDAFKRNIFLRKVADGEARVGLIDWGFTGIAAVGEEIAPLVKASFVFGEARGIAPETLDRAVFAAYVDGLRDASWKGDAALVRAGYLGSLPLRYGIGPLRMTLSSLANERMHPVLEQVFGMPVDTFVDFLAWNQTWLLELADEFRALLRDLAPLPSRVA